LRLHPRDHTHAHDQTSSAGSIAVHYSLLFYSHSLGGSTVLTPLWLTDRHILTGYTISSANRAKKCQLFVTSPVPDFSHS